VTANYHVTFRSKGKHAITYEGSVSSPSRIILVAKAAKDALAKHGDRRWASIVVKLTEVS
jgi:hypothetical protein